MDDKKVKDSCDIYALLWNSPVRIEKIVASLRSEYPELYTNANLLVEDGLATVVSNHLGVDKEVYTGVIDHLLK